jgi:hypothetical protein
LASTLERFVAPSSPSPLFRFPPDEPIDGDPAREPVARRASMALPLPMGGVGEPARDGGSDGRALCVREPECLPCPAVPFERGLPEVEPVEVVDLADFGESMSSSESSRSSCKHVKGDAATATTGKRTGEAYGLRSSSSSLLSYSDPPFLTSVRLSLRPALSSLRRASSPSETRPSLPERLAAMRSRLRRSCAAVQQRQSIIATTFAHLDLASLLFVDDLVLLHSSTLFIILDVILVIELVEALLVIALCDAEPLGHSRARARRRTALPRSSSSLPPRGRSTMAFIFLGPACVDRNRFSSSSFLTARPSKPVALFAGSARPGSVLTGPVPV